jgi:hypothetical protein
MPILYVLKMLRLCNWMVIVWECPCPKALKRCSFRKLQVEVAYVLVAHVTSLCVWFDYYYNQ